MNIKVRAYRHEDAPSAIQIWNTVIEEGVAFPQLTGLTEESGDGFFSEQTYTGIAYDEDTQEVVGLYILHPNNEAGADISAMPATPSKRSAEGSISGKSWFWTACSRPTRMDSGFSNSTQL